jgi:Tlde1 domain
MVADLYVYSTAFLSALLVFMVWSCRGAGASSEKRGLLLFLGVFILPIGAMLCFFGEDSTGPIVPQAPNAPAMAAPSDGFAFPEQFLRAANSPAPHPPGATLAYAAPGTDLPSPQRNASSVGLFGMIDNWTAVYDISAHTVYMPDGTMLEAHSGRGSRLDNPQYMHEHMKGATPPHVYRLTPRERPFHKVRALRLLPVGRGNLFGRTGFLAHTYMLGPNGDSNGCVVFKHYDMFLQAFESGEVKRLVVVTHLD